MARIDGTKRARVAWAGQLDSRLLPKPEEKGHDKLESLMVHGLQSSNSILGALGDDSSRRILTSAMATGKTVEEISADENLPLSTCYRRVRQFLDDGLMVLEKLILTETGKRYAIYRTSFSEVSVRFSREEVLVEATPNVEVLDKLRTRWLSANYPARNQVDFSDVDACRNG